MEIMTEEQWAERDKKDAEIRQAQQLASGLPNALSWRKDQNDSKSPSLEIDPQGMLTLTVDGVPFSAPIERWHSVKFGTRTEAQADVEPIEKVNVEELPNPLKASKKSKAQETASV